MRKLDEIYESFPILMSQVMAELAGIGKAQESIRFYNAELERRVAKLERLREILAAKKIEIEREARNGLEVKSKEKSESL